MADFIVDIVGQEALDQIEKRVPEALDALAQRIVEINANVTTLNTSLGSNSGVKDMVSSLNNVKKSNEDLNTVVEQEARVRKELEAMIEKTAQNRAKLVALQTEQAKTLADVNAELSKNSKALKEEADGTRLSREEKQKATEEQKKAREVAKAAHLSEKAEAQEMLAIQKAVADRIKADAKAKEEAQKKVVSAIKEETKARLDEQKIQDINRAQAAKLQKSIDDETKAIALKNNAYEQLRIKYKESAAAATQLGAQLFNLKNSGKASKDEIVNMAKASDEANKKAMELAQGLYQIEVATGNSKRAAGGFNALVWETNQLMREMPNFAMSARTGLMSLSNNLPMFAAAFAAVSKEIDVNTQKQKGFTGALKQMGGAIFSVQGLLIAAIVISLQYYKEIAALFNITSSAEKAQKAYAKALEDTTKSHAKEISELLVIQKTLSNNLSSRNQILEALNDFNRIHPGILDGLTQEQQITKLLTGEIDKQVEALIRRAQYEAAAQGIQEATEGVTTAFLKQSEKLGFWRKQWVVLKDEIQKGGTEGWFRALTGEIDDNAISMIVAADNAQKLTKAEEQLTMAVKIQQNPMAQQIEAGEKQIETNNKVIASREKYINHIAPSAREDYRKEIELLKQSNDEIERKIKNWNAENDARLRAMRSVPIRSQLENDRIDLEQRMLFAKNNSKEELKLKKDLSYATYRVELEALEQTYKEKYHLYGYDLHNNAEYLKDQKTLYANYINDLQGMDEKFEKKNKKKKGKQPYDFWKDEMEARKRLLDAQRKTEQDRIDNEFESNRAIADNEKLYLQDRLDANARMRKNVEAMIINTTQYEIDKKKEELAEIDRIETKAIKSRSTKEQILFLNRSAINAELVGLEEKLNNENLKAANDYEKKRQAIIKSNTAAQIKLVTEAQQEINTEINLRRNEDLVALNDKLRESNMTYRQYYKERKNIIAKYDKEIYEASYQGLESMLKNISLMLLDSNLSQEEKDAIDAKQKAILKAMANLSPDKGTIKERSIWEFLGFGGGKSDEDMKKEIAKAIEDLYSTMLDAIDEQTQRRFDAEKDRLEEEKRLIKERYDEERNAVMSSVMTREERELALKKLDKEREAREKLNDARARQNERNRAVREKQDAMFRASIEMGVAIAKALSSSAPPYNFILAALVGAQGLANLSMISSRSIPAYAEGTDNHPGGLAIVGDAGKELVNLPSGKSFLTENKPTLIDLPKGTEVIPNHQLLDNAHASALHESSAIQGITPEDYASLLISSFERELSSLGNRIESAIGKIPKDSIVLKDGELLQLRQKQNAKTKYINKIRGVN